MTSWGSSKLSHCADFDSRSASLNACIAYRILLWAVAASTPVTSPMRCQRKSRAIPRPREEPESWGVHVFRVHGGHQRGGNERLPLVLSLCPAFRVRAVLQHPLPLVGFRNGKAAAFFPHDRVGGCDRHPPIVAKVPDVVLVPFAKLGSVREITRLPGGGRKLLDAVVVRHRFPVLRFPRPGIGVPLRPSACQGFDDDVDKIEHGLGLGLALANGLGRPSYDSLNWDFTESQRGDSILATEQALLAPRFAIKVSDVLRG